MLRAQIDRQFKIKRPCNYGKSAYTITKDIVWLLSIYRTFINGNLDFLWNLDWEYLGT